MARRLWDKGEALDAEVLAFTVGDDPTLDLQLVEEDCWGSLAHSAMLHECGLLSAEDHRQIAAGLRQILEEHRSGAFGISREEEDVHTAVEGRLTALIGEAGSRLHTGRSRNDQVLVDIRLYAKRRLLLMAQRASALAEALLRLAEQEQETLLPGYTHLRQAMPSSVGLWAAGHAEGLEEDIEGILAAYRAVDRCPLGSAAGFGVPLELNRRRTAELLGFERLQINAQNVQSSRGKAEAQALLAAALLGQDLGRLAWDLQLYSSPEFGFFRLPPNVATGSSIMPQKRNPDVLELTRAQSAVLQACLNRVLLVAGKLPSSYHRDYQLTKAPLLEGLQLATTMARVMELTVDGLSVERARAEGALTPGAFSTHRALELTQAGVPFREAYRRVGQELSEHATGGTAFEPPELSSLYGVEGSASDLRLPEAGQRLSDLSVRVEQLQRQQEERLRALEETKT